MMNLQNMSPLRCAGSLAIVQRIHEANLLTMKLRCVCVSHRCTASWKVEESIRTMSLRHLVQHRQELDSMSRLERRGEERRGEERKGKERKGKEWKGKERKGKERRGKERRE